MRVLAASPCCVIARLYFDAHGLADLRHHSRSCLAVVATATSLNPAGRAEYCVKATACPHEVQLVHDSAYPGRHKGCLVWHSNFVALLEAALAAPMVTHTQARVHTESALMFSCGHGRAVRSMVAYRMLDRLTTLLRVPAGVPLRRAWQQHRQYLLRGELERRLREDSDEDGSEAGGEQPGAATAG